MKANVLVMNVSTARRPICGIGGDLRGLRQCKRLVEVLGLKHNTISIAVLVLKHNTIVAVTKETFLD